MKWFTSDLHFGHKNIIEICDRPTTFENLEDWIIKQLSDHIQPDEEVMHVGDFLFAKDKHYKDEFERIVNKLPGIWSFVPGNHDNKHINVMKEVLEGTNHKVLPRYVEMNYNKRKLVICHYPFRSWNNSRNGSINIHGHEHGANKTPVKNQIDVGLDAIKGFVPITIEDIIKYVDSIDLPVVDHHQGQKTGAN